MAYASQPQRKPTKGNATGKPRRRPKEYRKTLEDGRQITVNQGIHYDDDFNRMEESLRGKATKAGLNQLNADEFESTYLPEDEEKKLVKGFYKFIEKPEEPEVEHAIPPPPPPFGGDGNDWNDNNLKDYIKNQKKQSETIKEWTERTGQNINELKNNWDTYVQKLDNPDEQKKFNNWAPNAKNSNIDVEEYWKKHKKQNPPPNK